MEPKQVSDPWEQAVPYERYMGRWSRKLAPLFLSWSEYETGQRWLDVGCGTGALSGAIVEHCSPGSVVGVEPSLGFLRTARRNLAERVNLFQGTGTAIALEPGAVDAVVSGLALNFISDPQSALLEMARVSHPGGHIGAYVWDYAEKMEPLQIFWEVAAEIDQDAAQFDQGHRFPLCHPQALTDLFNSAGLQDTQVEAIDLAAIFVDFEDYWQPFLGGQGSAPAYLLTLDGNQRVQLRDRLFERLPVQPDGSIPLMARAWAVRGTLVG
jgi:SAM-dependent methyltransferase